jgi:hypothetical protein
MACRMPKPRPKKRPIEVTHGCGHGDCAPITARAFPALQIDLRKSAKCGWGVPYVMNCKSLVTKATGVYVPVSMSSKGWAKLLRNIEVYYIIATMT